MGVLRPESKLFGSERRTELLLLLRLLGETYPAELARLLEATPVAVTKIVDGLELEGVLASRRLGRTRRLTLEPRYYAARELEALLLKLAEADPRLVGLAAKRRSRPRRKGKSLE